MTTFTVGTGQQYSTLTAAVAAAQTGDTIDVQAGTYTNDFPGLINGLTIEGVGGIASFVATAAPPNGKAILDVTGNTTLSNLDISGVSVNDGNGAAVRYEGGNLVIQNSIIHGNQNGILGAADPTGTITITGSEFYGNGSGTGYTHNIYIGDIAQFTLTGSYIHDVNTGHEVKSRAENNTITNNVLADNTGTGSYVIDLPNGGNAVISGNTIQKSVNAGNRVAIAYGEEGSLHAGTSVTVTNNTIISDASGSSVFNDAGNAAVVASGNTIYNFASIDTANVVSSNGFTTVTSRPTINETSPVTNTGSPPDTGTPTDPPPPVNDTVAPVATATENLAPVTNQTVAVISGTASDTGSGVARVEIFDVIGGQSIDLGAATLASDGSWSFTTSTLVDGSHAFSAVATDVAGNAAAAVSAGAAVMVDTTTSNLTIAQNLSGNTTLTSNVIHGTVSDSGSGVGSVDVYDTLNGVTTDMGAAALDGAGNWSFAASGLALGDHYFSAATTDVAGNATRLVYAGVADSVVAATDPAPPPVSDPPGAAITMPAVQSMVGNADGSYTFAGVGTIASQIVLVDAGTDTKLLGNVTTDGTGAWSFTTSDVNTAASNTLVAVSGNVASGGAFVIAGTASETLSASAGQADVFAFLPGSGQDVVNGFETTQAVGANHDVVDLIGSSYTSFSQLQAQISGSGSSVIGLNNGSSITLTGVSAGALQASDFRFG